MEGMTDLMFPTSRGSFEHGLHLGTTRMSAAAAHMCSIKRWCWFVRGASHTVINAGCTMQDVQVLAVIVDSEAGTDLLLGAVR